MSSLKAIEKKVFEDLFGMASGYVLDFSNNTFTEFFRETANIDIYAPKYDFNGDSKAKRLRAFWESEPDALPANIHGYIQKFDSELTDEEFANPHYAYRILFVPKTANRKGQADRVIEFVKSDSPLAETVNKEYAVIKETEKKKYLPKQVVDLMKAEGYPGFTIHYHTQLWRSQHAKTPAKGYGTMVAGKVWHWYERWVDVVRKHCRDSGGKYS
ncbi:hypothetical protein [Pelobacter propionicus]|uniref:Uncharacterized protein n=1 Tax=Pelobacter propionicus (strain DSM 2379 / NBRC 103807 / OttBd1) TaxID=338966 RepID=A1ANH2_PELPD|nr:hypothetical protein [Pelobacter propionicus]ABK98892.1 hypothetical protein Ppro_1271 [Pelobacter propionicus DSM 2379]